MLKTLTLKTMTLKSLTLAAVGAATLALPAAATAQTYGFHSDPPRIAIQYYGAPQGDWDRDRYRAPQGYPEFRGIEDHIQREIREGVRQDLIERDDARDLMGQLRDIQMQESRELRVHGWNLPNDDRYRIRARLQQLDRLVDQIRDEQ
jgi:hypothetical protein